MPKQRKWEHIIPILFFAALLVLGLSLVSDYGISWDEEWQHTNAEVSAQYVNEWFPFTEEKISDLELKSYWNRHHGVFFTLSAYFLERAMGYDLEMDYAKIHLLRHRLVFLLFWLACIFQFKIGKLCFRDWKWALAGTLLLVLSPRIFGHAFFNPKDIVVLAFYVFSTYTYLGILHFKKWHWGLFHAFTCALLISSRIAGIIVPALTLLFLVADLIDKRFERKLLGQYGLILLVFLPFLFGFTVGFWPLLWKQPLVAFAEVFEAMSAYPWEGKVLLHGQFFPAESIPWYYVPRWIAVTTPVLYLIFGVLGGVFILLRTFKGLRKFNFFYDDQQKVYLLFLGLFLGPPLAVIYKGSVVYDGWRHLYFVYPSFLMMALIGFKQLYQWLSSRKYNQVWNYVRKGLIVLVSASFLYTIWFMVRYHPHQNVYFSEWKQSQSQWGNYELDYWGLSYKQGFEALAALDNRDTIHVAYNSYPAQQNWRYLAPEIKNRFVLVEKIEEADYFLSNFRHWEHGLNQYREKKGPYTGKEVYQIYVGKTKVFGIYRMK